FRHTSRHPTLPQLAISALFFFFFHDTATTEIYTLSLHDALPIYSQAVPWVTSGRWKFTTSSWALSTSSRVASSPRRRIPVGWARPSRSMPRQRALPSCHCSSLISLPSGDSQVTSLTPSSSLYSPTTKRPRWRIG